MNDSSSPKRYVQLDHTGDIQIKVLGNSIKELFINAAYALFDTITDADKIGSNLAETVEVSGIDKEELLVNWLSELNYVFLTESKVFSKFDIDYFKDNELSATVIGEKFNAHKHALHKEIKAITFHDLHIEKVGEHWETKIVFDI